MPSLIHGGKAPAKIGNFASHGCVGMTNAQVRDFARVLAQAANTELPEETLNSYLKHRNRTQVLNLSKLVPVELRYETIVFEDGQLHIYRDVYDQNTNTDEKLRAVLVANGVSLDDLTTEERDQALAALNAMSRLPKKKPAVKATPNAGQLPERTAANANPGKAEAPPTRTARNQKEIIVEITTVLGLYSINAIDSSCMACTATQKKTLIMAGANSGTVIRRKVRSQGAPAIWEASSSSPCT
jgi:hypothetical protein